MLMILASSDAVMCSKERCNYMVAESKECFHPELGRSFMESNCYRCKSCFTMFKFDRENWNGLSKGK